MNFVSAQFGVFLAVVFVVYWLLPRRGQNFFLLLASLTFYAAWDWRFLSLILISTVVAFVGGREVHATEDPARRKAWLVATLVIDLGILAYFKYAGFFLDSLVTLASSVGWTLSSPTLNIILPVGISFYTFQTLSYTLDIYRRQLEPTPSLLDFATFVAFFPQLVAGPIVRAREFLYQLDTPRKFSAAAVETGAIRFLQGFFLKAVVADVLALRIVDPVFAAPASYSAGSLWLGIFAYTAQIFADFAGYSSMAVGAAAMLGFEIPENFKVPYLATSFSDFWRRWHMTMSRFFRDYVYIPLGGSRGSAGRVGVNLAVTTLISGLWHGAAWTFVAWGGLHGLFIMLTHMTRDTPVARWRYAPIAGWLVTFLGVMGAWVLFRAQSFRDAGDYFVGLMGGDGLSVTLTALPAFCLLAVVAQHVAGWLSERDYVTARRVPPWIAAAYYLILIVFAYHGMPEAANPFIYFQF